MSTKLCYLSNTYLFEKEALIKSIEKNTEETCLILDQTIFYPQGGGQPCDLGMISTSTGKFKITNVRLTADGIVQHYGFIAEGNIEAKQTAQLEVDQIRRIENAKIHTAGHLVDIAVTKTDIKNLVATKGFHNPQGPYVEFKGTLDNPTFYIQLLDSILKKLVEEKLEIITKELSNNESNQKNIYAPPGKLARFVYFEGYQDQGCGCGGTHVKTTKELKNVLIRKIKSKKGITRISYQVA